MPLAEQDLVAGATAGDAVGEAGEQGEEQGIVGVVVVVAVLLCWRGGRAMRRSCSMCWREAGVGGQLHGGEEVVGGRLLGAGAGAEERGGDGSPPRRRRGRSGSMRMRERRGGRG